MFLRMCVRVCVCECLFYVVGRSSYSIHDSTAKSQSLDVTVLGHETGCFDAKSGNVFACSWV